MNLAGGLFLALIAFCLAQSFRLFTLRQAQQRLERKLDAVIKQQGIEWPRMSPEARRLAQDPRKTILAIKLHRDENPGMSLLEAKKDVEDCRAGR